MLRQLRLPTIGGVLLCLAIAWLAIRAAAIGMLGGLGDRAPFGFVSHAAAVEDVTLRRLAVVPLDDGSADALNIRAKALVERYPIAFNAAFAAAMAADQQGEGAAAGRLMRLAVERNPRNRVARSWLVAKALPEARYEEALTQLDAIMRMQPNLSVDMTKAMVRFLLAPGMVEAFAEASERGAPWMAAFLDEARRDETVAPQVYALVDALAERRSPALTDASAMQVIQSALGRGDYRDARRMLLATDAFARADSTNFIVDPAFQDERTGRDFGWRLGDPMPAGASVDLDGQLRVVLDSADEGILLNQQLVAGPGTYRLSIVLQGRTATGADALIWRVTCGQSGQDIATRAVGAADRPGNGAGLTFTIPAGCGAPRLSLANVRAGATTSASFSRIALRRTS
jgi:hypothetical protein